VSRHSVLSGPDVAAYVERINYRGPLEPTIDTLRGLHRAHHLAVPFENLDIHLGRAITLDESQFFDKIVNRRRGGFCYEMNGLFAALLRGLGFDVTLLSARVGSEKGGFGPEFDHLTLLVQLEERWLADVGFGDSFREPLRLDYAGEQAQDGEAYRIAQEGDLWKLLRSEGSEWNVEYVFTLRPRLLADFAGMCHYHQTSPESHFTRGRICSLATPGGRISLADTRLIITDMGVRREEQLGGEQDYAAALWQRFGIKLP
jgi:N-hydroxyarylamine O-acetyltransferase